MKIETIISHPQDQQMLRNLLKSKVAKEVEQQERLDTAAESDDWNSQPTL